MNMIFITNCNSYKGWSKWSERLERSKELPIIWLMHKKQ